MTIRNNVASCFDSMRPLKNLPFGPISANFNPRSTQCIPVVKIFAFLELEKNEYFSKVSPYRQNILHSYFSSIPGKIS